MRRFAFITFSAIAILLAAWFLWPERAVEITPQPPGRAEPAPPPVASARTVPVAVTEGEAISPAPMGGGAIIGRVYTMDGSAVTEGLARVTRMTSFRSGIKAPVQEAGIEVPLGQSADFTVTGLKAGQYAIEVASGNLAGREGILLLTDETVARVAVRVRPAAGLAGVVVGDGGAPLAGARVRLVSYEGNELNSNQRVQWDMKTETDGAFAFDGLQPGAWQACVSAAGYAPLVSEALHTGDADVRLELTHGGRISGRALEGDSMKPAAGIALKATFGGISDIEAATVTTESDGHFEFADLAPGTHALAPANPEYVLLDGAVRVDVEAERPLEGLVLRIGASATLRGLVFDAATGGGMEGAVVTATARDGSAPDRWLSSTPADDAGAYEIVGLAEGSYDLSVGYLPPGYTGPAYEEGAEMRFEAVLGETVEGKDIPVHREGIVAGIVVEADRTPVSGAEVEARATDGFQWGDTVSGEGGRFTLPFAPGREIYLRATSFDRRSRLEGPLLVLAEGLSNLRLVLNEASDAGMAGIVVDRAGNPLRAHVTARPTDMDIEKEDTRRVETTGADGLFLFMGLPPGEYGLSLGPVGDFIQEAIPAATIQLAAGEMRSGLRLVYDDSAVLKISGHVVDSEGRPIKDANIHASASACPGGADGFTDEDGAYTILNVCDGQNDLRVSHPQYGRQFREGVEAGSENVDFVLVRRGTVVGQVIDAATGTPLTAYQITSEGRQSVPRYQSISDPLGQFSVEAEPGNVYLRVRAPGYAEQEHLVEPPLEPGEDRDGILIELQRDGQ